MPAKLVVGDQVYNPATEIFGIVIRGALDCVEMLYLDSIYALCGRDALIAQLEEDGYEWMTLEQYEDLEASTENAWEARLKGES